MLMKTHLKKTQLKKTTVALICTGVLLTGCGDAGEVLETAPAPAAAGGADSPDSAGSAASGGVAPLVIEVVKEGKNAYAQAVEDGQEVHVELETCEGCEWKVEEAGDSKIAAAVAPVEVAGTPPRTRVIVRAVGSGNTNVVLGSYDPSGTRTRTVVISLGVT